MNHYQKGMGYEDKYRSTTDTNQSGSGGIPTNYEKQFVPPHQRRKDQGCENREELPPLKERA